MESLFCPSSKAADWDACCHHLFSFFLSPLFGFANGAERRFSEAATVMRFKRNVDARSEALLRAERRSIRGRERHGSGKLPLGYQLGG